MKTRTTEELLKATEDVEKYNYEGVQYLQELIAELSAKLRESGRYKRYLVKIRDEAKSGMKVREYDLACEGLETITTPPKSNTK